MVPSFHPERSMVYSIEAYITFASRSISLDLVVVPGSWAGGTTVSSDRTCWPSLRCGDESSGSAAEG